jgi:hypothetical protein
MDNPLTIAKGCGKFKPSRRGFMCQCPVHNDRNPSMEIWMGEHSVLVWCYAGCPSDMIVDELRDRGFQLGRRRPREEAEARSRRRKAEPPPPSATADVSYETQKKTRFAADIWRGSCDPVGTPVETYLRGRGLPLIGAGEVIRFHPNCPRGAERRPAMITLLRDLLTDKPVGIHRTYLASGGGHDGKMMLGACAGAAAKLTPQADTFVQDHLGVWCERLHVCEGIETGLALIKLGRRPVWSLLSAGAIARMPVMPSVGELIVCADSDDIGIDTVREPWARFDTGQNAAFAAVDSWQQAGRRARVLMPFGETRKGDFADVAGR